MGEANRLPDGWEWTGWSRRPPTAGTAYLYPPGESCADFVGAAHSNGSWSAYASLDDAEPCAEHEADDDAAFTPEALAAAQRDVEAALWRVDGYGRGEVRGYRVLDGQSFAVGATVPYALPGLPGLWTVTAIHYCADVAETVDAVRAVVEPADPEASVHVEVVRNPRAFALRRAEPTPVASEADDELVRLRARVAELEAAHLSASVFEQRTAEMLIAKVAELETDLVDLQKRYAETKAAFDEAAPDALRALHKRQNDAQRLDVRHGPEMAEKIRAALRQKPVAVKDEERGCPVHTGAIAGLNCAACIRASTAKGGA